MEQIVILKTSRDEYEIRESETAARRRQSRL